MGIGEITRLTTPTTIETAQSDSRVVYYTIKRFFDILLSLIAIILLSPLFLAIAVAIKLDSSGPVIYRQRRVRGNQNPNTAYPERNLFAFFKFRSMYANCDATLHRQFMTQYINGNAHETNNGCAARPIYKMRKDPRITRVGCFLRRTSLDELPQLFNVLKGDMSLVGPRPALSYEVEQYGRAHRARLVPRAGLTGLWQVSGRTGLTFEEMVQLDITYAQECSLWLDLKILLKTIPTVLSGDGAW